MELSGLFDKGFQEELHKKSHSLLVLDSLGCEAGFLLLHFTTSALNSGRDVCFLGFSQIYNHYFLSVKKWVIPFLFLINLQLPLLFLNFLSIFSSLLLFFEKKKLNCF